MKDLVILVADKSMGLMVERGIARHQNLGIRPILLTREDLIVHVNRDGGVRTTGADILRSKIRSHTHALMMLDFEGCGDEKRGADILEAELDARLARDWGDRAKAIVIVPELEIWVWGEDVVIESVIGWNRPVHVREWLTGRDYAMDHLGKPLRPKEAFQAVMKECRKPASSDWFGKIAQSVGFARCRDGKFALLRQTLQKWFPQESR